MGRVQINIAGLMVVVAVLAILFASLRENSGIGVHLVFCIALALNFAAIVVLPTGLDDRFRMMALGYAIGGWGWMLIVAILPGVDSLLRDYLVIPNFLRILAPHANPKALVSNPMIGWLLLLAHSLSSISAGLGGAFVAGKLGARFVDPDRSTIPTTVHP